MDRTHSTPNRKEALSAFISSSWSFLVTSCVCVCFPVTVLLFSSLFSFYTLIFIKSLWTCVFRPLTVLWCGQRSDVLLLGVEVRLTWMDRLFDLQDWFLLHVWFSIVADPQPNQITCTCDVKRCQCCRQLVKVGVLFIFNSRSTYGLDMYIGQYNFFTLWKRF